ncbi:unnamed protein product, partial [Phaeothamnion confervicola]
MMSNEGAAGDDLAVASPHAAGLTTVRLEENEPAAATAVADAEARGGQLTGTEIGDLTAELARLSGTGPLNAARRHDVRQQLVALLKERRTAADGEDQGAPGSGSSNGAGADDSVSRLDQLPPPLVQAVAAALDPPSFARLGVACKDAATMLSSSRAPVVARCGAFRALFRRFHGDLPAAMPRRLHLLNAMAALVPPSAGDPGFAAACDVIEARIMNMRPGSSLDAELAAMAAAARRYRLVPPPPPQRQPQTVDGAASEGTVAAAAAAASVAAAAAMVAPASIAGTAASA